MTTSLKERLAGTASTIEEILKISNSAGVSVGVAANGVPVFKKSFGFRDHSRKCKADSSTLYKIGSLTKTMTAAAMGVAVHKGVLDWDTRVRSVIPEYRPADAQLADNLTVTDLLCHRSGIPTANALWYQGGSKPLVTNKDIVPMMNAMPPAFGLRSSWGYSNWPFAMAGEVISRAMHVPWQTVLREHIWEPLNMTRTRSDAEWRAAGNAADGFSGLPDGELFPLASQIADDSSVMGAAGGVASCIDDLLAYYTGLMSAAQDPDGTETPFKEVGKIVSSHSVLDPAPFGLLSVDTNYTMGLVRTRLPAQLGVISDNAGLVKRMPVMGKGCEPQLVLYHSGTLSGFYASVYLLPETKSCVVALVNTKPICDSADWIAQTILQEVLGMADTHDFVELTRECVNAQKSRYETARETLEQERVSATNPKPLKAYCGRYYWTCPTYFIDIAEKDGDLELTIIGREDQHYKLKHYHYDTFTWLMTDEEEGRRGRFIQSTHTYKLIFKSDERGNIDGLTWPSMGGMDGNFSRKFKL